MLNISPTALPNLAKMNFINRFYLPPIKDSISFTGKQKPRTIPENSSHALEFGKELYTLNENQFEFTKNYVKQNDINAEVLPVEELKNYIPDFNNYSAFVYSDTDENCKFKSSVMFISTAPKYNDSTGRLLNAMTCAHEYTHLLQHSNNNQAEFFLKNASNGDYNYAKLIMTFGNIIFKSFDTQMQAETAIKSIRKNMDIKQFEKYQQIVPQAAKISDNDILKNLHLRDMKALNKYFNDAYKTHFKKTMDAFYKSTDYPQYKKYLQDKNKLQKDVKKFCALCAKDEYEAYTTESELAKTILGASKLNIDIFTSYYWLLMQALGGFD